MLEKKEEKVASTVHLNRSQVQEIDHLARRTGQSRAYVLRKIVDAGLSALSAKKQSPESIEKEKQIALERLLRMGEGYGESGKSIIGLDDELYGD